METKGSIEPIYEVLLQFWQHDAFRRNYFDDKPAPSALTNEIIGTFLKKWLNLSSQSMEESKSISVSSSETYTLTVNFNRNGSGTNKTHTLSFSYQFASSREINPLFSFCRKSNGPDDFVKTRLSKKHRDTATLFACISLFICAEFQIKSFAQMEIAWSTLDKLYASAANLERYFYKQIFSTRAYCANIQKRTFKNDQIKTITPAAVAKQQDIILLRQNEMSHEYECYSDEWKVKVTPYRANELRNLYEIAAEEIVRSAMAFPLRPSIMRTKDNDSKRKQNIITLLKQLCQIELLFKPSISAKVTVSPIIASTMQQFDDAFDFLKSEFRNYTKYDALLFIGAFAQYLSQEHDTHACTNKEMKTFCRQYSFCSQVCVEEIRQDLLGKVHFIIEEDMHFKFTHKLIRLVFFGIYSGLQENQISQNIRAEDMLLRVAENTLLNRKQSSHIHWNYDPGVIYGCAFLNALNKEKREHVLDGLCRISADANILNRDSQEKAIAILSYYLCEGTEYTGEYREKVFLYAYAKDMYAIQETMWTYLKDNSPFYYNAVEICRDNACKLGEDEYALLDPYYIYLWWDLSATKTHHLNFVRNCCIIQHHSWFGKASSKNSSNLKIDDMLQKIDTCIEVLDGQDEEKKLPYVYGLNMLLLSLANIKILPRELDTSEQYSVLCEKLNDIAVREQLIRAAIRCDYYTRKFNRTYNEVRSENWGNDLFLLSGAIRFLCAYPLSPNGPIELSAEMLERYMKWYGNEKGRWKVLLARLLSYTSFFHQSSAAPITAEMYRSCHFLEYDASQDYADFCREIEERCRTLFPSAK